MRFAVHVIGDAAADGHELGPRSNHREPAARRKVAQDVLEAHAGLAAQGASCVVEAEIAVEARHAQHTTAGVERRIAIAPAEASRRGASRIDRAQDLSFEFRLTQVTVGTLVRAPARESSQIGFGRLDRQLVPTIILLQAQASTHTVHARRPSRPAGARQKLPACRFHGHHPRVIR